MAQALLSKTNPGEDAIPCADQAIGIVRASGVPYRVGPPRKYPDGR